MQYDILYSLLLGLYTFIFITGKVSRDEFKNYIYLILD